MMDTENNVEKGVKDILIDFSVIIFNGELYSRDNPGIAIADYADLLDWKEERDEQFWVRVENHYMEKSKFMIKYSYNEKTLIEDIEKTIVDKIGFNYELYKNAYVYVNLLFDNEFVRIFNKKLDIKTLTLYYDVVDTLKIYFVFSSQAGEIWNDEGLRYYMHSREAGKHNEIHIHVDYKHKYSVSISLKDGSVLDGDMPSKILKKAQKRITENKRFLMECWNKMTDGIKVDINHYFGICTLE